MERILNIGLPFQGKLGGDTHRARMELRALEKPYQVSNLLLTSDSDGNSNKSPAYDNDAVETIPFKPGRGFDPASVCVFDENDLIRFRELLRKNAYDIVFFRYITGTRLIAEVEKTLPNARIIIDADMLSSRIAAQAWKFKRSIRNRFFLFESWKVRRYERQLFNKPHLFLMSNCVELAWIRKNYLKPESKARFSLLPNTMPEVPSTNAEQIERHGNASYILFHGVLTSTVNMDALRFLLSDIYPLIHQELDKHGVKIHVVGKSLSAKHEKLIKQHDCSRIELVGEVEDIGQVLTEALFCLVPLRIGSGTKTRILEAAAYSKAVITTPIGAEGLEFSETELIVREKAVDIAQEVIHLLDDRKKIQNLGENIRAGALKHYSEPTVCRQLLQAIEGYQPA